MEEGAYGDVPLAGVAFSLFVKWPGPIHEGGGEGVLVVDEQADEQQRDAVATLVRGESGGPWGILGWTWPTLHGPVTAPHVVDRDGVNWSVKAGDYLELESEPIRNPVTADEIQTPSAVLPGGMIYKHGDLGSSRTLRVRDGITLDYADKYTAVGAFNYSGP